MRPALLAILAGVLLAGVSGRAFAGPPNGVDHLRGRWDGVFHNLRGQEEPFVMFLDDFIADPQNPGISTAAGCLAVGEEGTFAPLSAQAEAAGEEIYDLTIFGTAAFPGEAFIIKLTGQAGTAAPSVVDDGIDGAWQTSDEVGSWTAVHHDRRQPKCAAVTLGDGLFFSADVYAAVQDFPDDSRWASTILESYTNIVSSAVRVDMPDGSTRIMSFFTDLFSPDIDFINEFRFLDTPDGFPAGGGTYTFTLLDVNGRPIEGATTSDIWLACPVEPPRQVAAEIVAEGILATWAAVAPVPGFDPTGSPPQGYYQIELGPLENGGGGYGASSMAASSHLIPFAPFGGGAEGQPDGIDYGNALSELTDGWYGFNVIAFAEAPFDSAASGLECQIRAPFEMISLEKIGGQITFP